MYSGYNDPMPSDKVMKLFIIQAISSFVANDYETGMHFLSEIKQTYAEKMSQLNPTLKQLAKEIIQSVDMFNPDMDSNPFAEQASSGQGQTSQDQQNTQQPSSVASELQDLLRRRREKRKK